MIDQYDKHPNAQKWTADTVITELNEILRDADIGPSFFLGKALAKRGLYKQVWSYWKKTFHDNDEVMERILNIETMFEAKILEGALKKELSGSIAALTLKYNYHWNDKGKITGTNLISKFFKS